MPAGSILLKPYDLKPAKTNEEKELSLTVEKGLRAKQMKKFHTWSSHQVKINVEDTPSHLQSLVLSTTPLYNSKTQQMVLSNSEVITSTS
jgi:hypothetical protein